MKKLYLIITLFVLSVAIPHSLCGQDKFKFGSPPEELLNMTTYEKDTSAAAVIVYKECYVSYDFVAGDFRLSSRHVIRIKILKQAGTSWADFEIPYYSPDRAVEKESILGISGFSYNMEDGKLVKTKLSKEYIFDEKSGEDYHIKKISIPNVRAGSVVELKYECTSPHYTYIDSYYMQNSIPVVYAKYQVVIPDYFRFSKKTRGFERLDYSETRDNFSFTIGGDRISTNAMNMVFEGNDLPALKEDSFVWNKNDFMTKVDYELAGVQWPNAIYKSFAYTWENIDKQLMESDAFGKQFRYSGILKEERESLLKPEMSKEDQMEALLALVKSKVQWNEKKTLEVKNPKGALKQGVGSSGEMNALLMCLLRDAGFDAAPVVMSLRSKGRILRFTPTLKGLNYFIVRVDIDGKAYYMDASYKYGSVNNIPQDCMVADARLVGPQPEWVDLQNVVNTVLRYTILASFDEKGVLGGEFAVYRRGVEKVRHMPTLAKSAADYKEAMEEELNVSITGDEGVSKEVTPSSIIEKFRFELPSVNLSDDIVYLNPLISPMLKEFQFKAETRKLPIEFPHPFDHQITVSLHIPDNYVVEELPKSEKIILDEEGSITYFYLTGNKSNVVQVQQRTVLKGAIYPPTIYESLRDFWNRLVSKNNATMVLKKVVQ